MKNLPKQSRALLKRADLIHAAEAEFAELGYIATTAKSIAARAGVATGTFYQNFDNKDDLLRIIAHQRLSYLDNLVQPPLPILQEPDSYKSCDIQDLFKWVLTLIYDFHQRSPELHQVLEHRRCFDAQLKEILDQGEQILEDRVRLFVQTFNVASPDAVAFNLFAMAEGLVHRHVFNSTTTPKDEVLNLGAAMLSSYFVQQPSLQP